MADDSDYTVPCGCGGELHYVFDVQQPHEHRAPALPSYPDHWWACAMNAPRIEWCGPCDCDLSKVHWIGDAPTSLHGNGASSFPRTTRDPSRVTCKLCLTLLAREPVDSGAAHAG